MTTLGTHPFIPSAFKLGSAPDCQRCPNEASHPVHDWLTFTLPILLTGYENPEEDVLSAITPEEMVQLQNLPNGEPFEDIDGYCVRLNQQVRDIQQGGR